MGGCGQNPRTTKHTTPEAAEAVHLPNGLATPPSSITAARTANTIQEGMKAQLKNQTRTLNQLDLQVFEATTSGIDAFSGMFGKFSNEAVQLRRIRAKVRKPSPVANPPA